MTIPDPYAHSTFHDKPLDNATIARLKQAEKILGYELTILQGIGGAAASAGTHTMGRAVDLAPYDYARKVKVLRDLGFAIWHRPTLPGVWNEHIHGVLIFDGRDNQRGIAPAAWRQIGSYDRGRNGLANDAIDPDPYRPTPARGFSMADYRATFAAPKPVVKPQPKPAPLPPHRLPSTLTLRVHNQHDTAVEAGGYDVACLTECSPTTPGNMERHRTPLLKGLAIDYDPDAINVWGKKVKVAHPPIPGRSPQRGTLAIKGIHRASGRKVAVLVSHRINDRSGRHGRPMAALAGKLWDRHARMDQRWVVQLQKAGYLVFFGGDINDHAATLEPLVRAKSTLGHYDAIGYPDAGVALDSCVAGGKGGSDHAAFTAVFTILTKEKA